MDKTFKELKSAFAALQFAGSQAGSDSSTLAMAQFVKPLTKILLGPPGASALRLQAAIQAIGEAADIDFVEVVRISKTSPSEPELVWTSEKVSGLAAINDLQAISECVSHYNHSPQSTRVQDMEDTCLLKHRLLEMQLHSALIVPLPGLDRTSGLVLIASTEQGRIFSDAEILIFKTITGLIGSLLIRYDTELKIDRVQSELRSEKNRLQDILGALPDLVIELDSAGRMTGFYSKMMASLVENPERYIGASPEEALPERVAKTIRKVLREVDAAGSSEEARFHLRLPDQRHWFSVSGYRLQARDRSAETGYLLVIRDRTLEHFRTQELRHLGDIVKRTSNMVILTDKDGSISWVNKSFETRTGYKLSEIKGRKPGSFLQGPDTDAQAILAIRQALEKEVGIEIELLNYTKDGRPFWVDMDIQPYRDEEGELSGFMAIQSDVTERRSLIADLRKAEKKARADQAVAMDASRDGIAITDENGNFIYMNRAHMDMFAIETEEDIIGRSWSVLYTPAKADLINQVAFPKLLETKAWKGEIAGLRFDGTTIEQEVSLTLKEDGGLVCITRDIGARLRAQYERSRLREELQIAQRREIIGQMAAGLAHDFNNLIASISGSAALMLNSSDESNRSHIERIQLASAKATELVRRMLDDGTRNPQRQKIDLTAALNEVADLVQSGLSSETKILLPASSPEIALDADPTDFLQVILNLVINSRDALQHDRTPNPEVKISVDLVAGSGTDTPMTIGKLDWNTEYVRISVCDNGPGIDEKIRDQVFRPYFSTKDARGTGLGLTVVASIIEAYDGALKIMDNPQHGCRIDVFWPATPTLQIPVPTDTKADEMTGRLDGRSILLVDDSEELLRVLSIFLERAGAEVCVSTDPHDILDALRSAPHEWDLLITDFDMPIMNGAELAEEARRLNPTLPIVLITALPDWRGRAGGNYGRDFLAVLGKPLQASELVETAEIAIQSAGDSQAQESKSH